MTVKIMDINIIFRLRITVLLFHIGIRVFEKRIHCFFSYLFEQLLRSEFTVSINSNIDSFDQSNTPWVRLNLDDFGVFRPVIDAVLRKGTEWTQPKSNMLIIIFL